MNNFTLNIYKAKKIQSFGGSYNFSINSFWLSISHENAKRNKNYYETSFRRIIQAFGMLEI